MSRRPGTAKIARPKPTTLAKRRGGGKNPSTNPSPRTLELQEKAFLLHADGMTCREIAAELQIDKDTAAKYVKIEWNRRSEAWGEQRIRETLRAVARYEKLGRRAEQIADNPQFPGDTGRLADAIKARERIDKLLGIEAAQKVDIGVGRRVTFEVIDVVTASPIVEQPALSEPVNGAG